MTKTAKIICWVRAPRDHRDCASCVATAIFPQKIVAKLARDIDRHGSSGAGEFLPNFRLADGHKLASGHGVHVYYDSGRTRCYRGQ